LLRNATAQPGYVRLVLDAEDTPRVARAAGRRFALLCREEDASRGLIVAGDAGSDVDWEDALAASRPGFRLAVVARGQGAGQIARTAASLASRRGAAARVFKSEHQAAAWLMA